MAPAARRERAEMSAGRKPYACPRTATERRNSDVISAGVRRHSVESTGSR